MNYNKYMSLENKKILIVDDEKEILNLISKYAKNEKMLTKTAKDGVEAVDFCKKEDFDIIIMDIMMGKTSGYDAVKLIKEKKDIPIIMLSARETEIDKLKGFELGIDDYVTKSFSLKELFARINVVISRNRIKNVDADVEEILNSNDIKVNITSHEVFVKNKRIELTSKEFDILVYFIENKNRVLTREMILNHIWGYDYLENDRTVDWQLKLLRNKLGKTSERIKTIRGVGYKFEE